MNSINELAMAAWKSEDNWPNASDKAFVAGYEAGFRKAREMAADLMRSKTQHDSLFVPGYIDALILGIGESEV